MPSEAPGQWKNQAVQLVPYDPDWASRFEAEAAALAVVLQPWVAGGIHHIGSTAVPGLNAKPIIDIAVGVESLETSRPCIDLLKDLEYLYSPYLGEVMHWFCKPDLSHRTHHLHLIPTGSPRLEDEIAFRDYLRAHPDVAEEYGALKRRLAAEHTNDREAYTRAKSGFVRAATNAAHTWSFTRER